MKAITRLGIVGGVLLALGGTAAEARDWEKLLRGDYVFTGEATCLISLAGFNADLTPVTPGPFPVVISFSVNGVRTFNGDGTGTLRAKIVGVQHPFALPTTPAPVFNRGGGQANDIESTFTYDVAPDLTLTIQTVSLGGTATAGVRVGQTFSISGVPVFHGRIAEHLDGITLAHDEPAVETLSWSNGDVQPRICHRSRVLLERAGRR